MSHFSTIKTKIIDLNTLDKAATKLGLQIVQGTTVRGFAGQTTQADRVYCVGSLYGRTYDIGAVKQAVNGTKPTYGLVTDEWAVNQIRPNITGKLVQEYQFERLRAQAKLMGHQVERESLPDGRMKVKIITR